VEMFDYTAKKLGETKNLMHVPN